MILLFVLVVLCGQSGDVVAAEALVDRGLGASVWDQLAALGTCPGAGEVAAATLALVAAAEDAERRLDSGAATLEDDEATTTLYACHDCDMAPEPNAGSHYFCDDVDGVGFARVLRAAGCRYAGDACFGGVTIYDDEAFERTNGYPNGFWGWGGEDNAAYDRAMRAEVAVERATSVAFDDLENIDTVEEKLERLDAHDARIKMKEKGVLLKHNAKRWREDGINSCKFDVISETTLFETPNATAVKYLCEFKTRRPGYAMCVTCKEDLHESMYSSGALLKIRWADKTSTAHDRSCAACTQSMPKQLKEKAQVEFNRNNPERLTCKTCCEKFSSRNALFKHLKASTTCGEVTK